MQLPLHNLTGTHNLHTAKGEHHKHVDTDTAHSRYGFVLPGEVFPKNMKSVAFPFITWFLVYSVMWRHEVWLHHLP